MQIYIYVLYNQNTDIHTHANTYINTHKPIHVQNKLRHALIRDKKHVPSRK